MVASMVIGAVGIVITGGLLFYWAAVAEYGWYLGLAALAPAWLLVVLDLIDRVPIDGTDVPLPPSVVLSSSVVLLGVIFTDFLNRRLPNWGVHVGRRLSYVLGVLALVPGWIVALWAVA